MSQGSLNVPTGGVETSIAFAGQCNGAWNALGSKNSGASQPANGPGNAPIQFMDWADTTNAALVHWRLYDGSQWDRVGSLDVANNAFLPKLGGGVTTVASAATVDLGTIPQTLIQISGTAAIGSFGSSAGGGEMKMIYALAAFTLVASANLICQGNQNINAAAGDMFMAIHAGSGVWFVFAYQRSNGNPGIGLPTGSLFWAYSTSTIPGAIVANGLTIGDASSGATGGTGAAYFNLFVALWNQSNRSPVDPEMVISGGRGASAIADWNAHKTITLPDMRGRTMFGRDAMNRTASSRMFNMIPDNDTLGATGGASFITLLQSQVPSFNLSLASLTWTQNGNSLTWSQSGNSLTWSNTGISVTGTDSISVSDTRTWASSGLNTRSDVTIGGNASAATTLSGVNSQGVSVTSGSITASGTWTQGTSSVSGTVGGSLSGTIGGSLSGAIGGTLPSGGTSNPINIMNPTKLYTCYIVL